MSMGKSRWAAMLCVIALGGFTGCSDDDTPPLNFDPDEFETGWNLLAPAFADFFEQLDPFSTFQGSTGVCQEVDCDGGSGSCKQILGPAKSYVYTFNGCGFRADNLGVSGTIAGELTYYDQLGGPEGERVIMLDVVGLGQVELQMSFSQTKFITDVVNPFNGQYLLTCDAVYDEAPCCEVIKADCFFN